VYVSVFDRGITVNLLAVWCADIVPFANSNTQQSVSVTEGEAVIIDLPPIDSYPAPDVYWRNILTGVRIMSSIQHYYVTLDNQLIILSSQMNRDNGTMFRAEARNIYTFESSQSPTFIVSVNGKSHLKFKQMLYI